MSENSYNNFLLFYDFMRYLCRGIRVWFLVFYNLDIDFISLFRDVYVLVYLFKL